MPWLRAARRAGVRARNASTPSARAESSSVFISRFVVAESRRLAGIGAAGLDVDGRHAVLALQQRQEPGSVELLGVVEAQAHRLRERLVALGDDVEQIADGNDVAELQAAALLDEELQHELEGGAFALQQRRYGNQGLYEGRREGVDLPEHPAVAVAGEQGGQDFFSYPRCLLESRRELFPGCRVLRAQHATFPRCPAGCGLRA